MNEAECQAPPDDEITRSADPSIWTSTPILPEAFGVAGSPLLGDLAVRVWYHQADSSSKFCPRQSLFHGPRPEGPHQGIDVFAPNKSKLLAVATGSIQYNVVSNPDGWGNHIYLYFRSASTRYICVYAHLDASSAFTGAKAVTAGGAMPVYSGCSGNAGGGICDRDHRCTFGPSVVTPIADHTHVELLRLTSDGSIETRLDPMAFFGWTIHYSGDNRCAPCLENVQTAT
jgi:hypothetical protein